VFFVVVGLVVTIACAVAAWRSRQHSRRIAAAWAVLAVGQLLWMLGDLTWFVLEILLKVQPYPSLADAFYLTYYGFFLGGIWLLPGERLTQIDRSKRVLDVSAVLVAATVIYWVLWLGPQLAGLEGTDPITLVISIGYPVGDLVLIWATVTLLMRPLPDLPRWPVILLGVSAMVGTVVDLLYAYQFSTGTYLNGGLLDLGWLVVLLITLWAAILQCLSSPSRMPAGPTSAAHTHRDGHPHVRLALPYVGLLITLALEAPFWNMDTDAWFVDGSPVLHLGAALLFLLVSVRQWLVLADNVRLASRLTAELDWRHAVEADLRNEVAARQVAQLAAEESQRFSAQLADAMPSHVAVIDWIAQEILYTNRPASVLRDAADGGILSVEGTRLFGHEVHPDDRIVLATALARLPFVADAEDLAFEVRVGDQARWRDLGFRCRVFKRDAQHAPWQLLVVWDDISTARQAERALAESQRLLSRITEAVPSTLSVWAVGAEPSDDQVVFQNRSLLANLGHPGPGPERREPTLQSLVCPDDLPRIQDARRSWSGLPDGAVLDQEFRLQDASGGWHWMQARHLVFARDAQGVVTQVIGVTEDVTHRRELQDAVQAERDFAQLVLNTLGQGVMVMDPQGRCEYINPAGAEILGLTHPEHLVGSAPLDDYARAVPAVALENWQDPGVPAPKVRFETQVTRADGPIVDLLTVVSPRFRDGAFVGTVTVFTDVTAHKAMQRELAEALGDAQAMTRAAQAATRAKSAFLANMSHEIRTPMSAVIGLAELLQDEGLPDEQRGRVQVMIDSGRALLDIINDILDFSKIEAGRLELEEQEFCLLTVVESTVDMVAQRARTQGLRLHTRVDPTLPAVLRGDASRLRQVLLNLVSNAVKFTKVGHVLVRAELATVDTGVATVVLHVQDTGIGIPGSAQARLFQPFEQAESSTTRRYGGTGLGLAIVKRLVDLMGGRIVLDSVSNVGTTVTVTLPFGVGSASPQRPAEPESRGRVLVIEPDRLAGEIIGCYLAAAGWAWTVAPDIRSVPSPLSADMGFTALVLGHWGDGTDVGPHPGSPLPDPRLECLPRVTITDTVAARPGRPGWVARPMKRVDLTAALRHVLAIEETGFEGHAPTTTTLVPVSNPKAKLRVLLAEDNPVNQMVAKLQLGKLGFEVDVVGNGAAVVAAYLATPDRFHLILMDCQMPILDGFESTRVIRAWESEQTQARHIPIVAMTANAMVGDREECLEAGMDDYLSKPVNRQALERILHSDPST